MISLTFASVCYVLCAVLQLGAVVGEKEVGLVTALRLMGLRQSAYWTSWIAADLLLGFATALSIVIWGEALLILMAQGLCQRVEEGETRLLLS
jgi:hypothetical protein